MLRVLRALATDDIENVESEKMEKIRYNIADSRPRSAFAGVEYTKNWAHTHTHSRREKQIDKYTRRARERIVEAK